MYTIKEVIIGIYYVCQMQGHTGYGPRIWVSKRRSYFVDLLMFSYCQSFFSLHSSASKVDI